MKNKITAIAFGFLIFAGCVKSENVTVVEKSCGPEQNAQNCSENFNRCLESGKGVRSMEDRCKNTSSYSTTPETAKDGILCKEEKVGTPDLCFKVYEACIQYVNRYLDCKGLVGDK